MEILNTALISALSVLMLYVLTRVIGYREIHQFSMFDYITGISIGSIAAEMATGLESFKRPLTAMLVYAAAAVLMAVITNKSVRFRKRLLGQPIILINNGVIYYDRMKKTRLDLSELLMELRARDYFDITDIKTVIMEINGNFSIIPFDRKNKSTELSVNLIMDGEIIYENIRSVGIDLNDIEKALMKNGIKSINDVFLGVYSKGEIKLFGKINSGKEDNYVF